MLAWVLRLTGRLCLKAYFDTPPEPDYEIKINYLILGSGLLAIGVGFVAISSEWPFGQAFFIPGAIVALISVLSLTKVQADTTIPDMVMRDVPARRVQTRPGVGVVLPVCCRRRPLRF